MSKKLKIRFALVAVALVWGYNLLRLYNNYKIAQDIEETQVISGGISGSPVRFTKDSFALELPSVDPFLKKMNEGSLVQYSESDKSRNVSNNSEKKITKKKEPPVEVPWPAIKYFGFVKNLDTKDALCLIQINGNMVKVSEGDQSSGIFVTSVFRDSIHLLYNKEERTFMK